MRTILLTLIFTMVLLPRLAIADTAQPVMMTAYLDKPLYQIGQPIVLEADLHNTGTQEAWIGTSAFDKSSFNFTITEASGRVVPRTALGILVFTPPWAVAANAGIKIAPGAIRRCRFNLTDLYGLLRTGRYQVVVRYTLGHFLIDRPTPALTAAPLKFQIAEANTARSGPATPFVHDPTADLNVP